MTALQHLGSHRLEARSVHRIEDGQGLEVTCLAGAVWITQSDDRRDIILEPEQSFILDRPGTALLFAFGDTTVIIGGPDAKRATAPARMPQAA